MPWRPTNPEKEQAKRERARQADKHRGTSAERGYGGKWRSVRKRYLAEHPLCIKCGKPAEIVDHIIPHRGDHDLMWNADNYQSLCKPCHDHKTGTEDTRQTFGYNFH